MLWLEICHAMGQLKPVLKGVCARKTNTVRTRASSACWREKMRERWPEGVSRQESNKKWPEMHWWAGHKTIFSHVAVKFLLMRARRIEIIADPERGFIAVQGRGVPPCECVCCAVLAHTSWLYFSERSMWHRRPQTGELSLSLSCSLAAAALSLSLSRSGVMAERDWCTRCYGF